MAEEIGRAHVCTPVTPRSTLFPCTPLFRSGITVNVPAIEVLNPGMTRQTVHETGKLTFVFDDGRRDRKSTRLHSSHTEIYTLSLHAALPIWHYSKRTGHRGP